VETVRKIEWVFGDDAMDFTQIMEWYSSFKHGHMTVESDSRSGRP